MSHFTRVAKDFGSTMYEFELIVLIVTLKSISDSKQNQFYEHNRNDRRLEK